MAEPNSVTHPQNPDIIAFLFPADDQNHQNYRFEIRADKAIQDPQNTLLHVSSVLDHKDGSRLCSRESTVALEWNDCDDGNNSDDGNEDDDDDDDEDNDSDDYGGGYADSNDQGSDGDQGVEDQAGYQKLESPSYLFKQALRFTFSNRPEGGPGFIFGKSEHCDIVLPNLTGIKRYHCCLTFDDKGRLVVKDLESRDRKSRAGTIVTYDGDGRSPRRNFSWIIGGHEVPTSKEKILIEFRENLKFQIVVCQHNLHQDAYRQNIDQFRGHCDLPRIRGLGVGSEFSTVAHTGSHTPGNNPIILKHRELGRGGFAVVTQWWNVSTGEEFALKEVKDARNMEKKRWELEVKIMGEISHEHIVGFISATFEPLPQLRLEYVPGGTLDDRKSISETECLTVLLQALDALTYLHNREHPMVHRDIKPSNILIQSWDPLHIKLADFGLANIGWELHTACGTLRYVAPEVYSGKYDSAVDIWSLGVVVFEYAHGLPRYEPREPRQGWYDRLVRSVKAESKKSPLLSFLSSSMIFWDPVIRFTAVMCLHKAKELSTSSKTAGANHKTIGFEKHIPVIESSELLPDTKVELLRKGVRDGAPEQRYVDPRVLGLDTKLTPASPEHDDSISVLEEPGNDIASPSMETKKRPTKHSTSSSSSKRPAKRRGTNKSDFQRGGCEPRDGSRSRDGL